MRKHMSTFFCGGQFLPTAMMRSFFQSAEDLSRELDSKLRWLITQTQQDQRTIASLRSRLHYLTRRGCGITQKLHKPGWYKKNNFGAITGPYGEMEEKSSRVQIKEGMPIATRHELNRLREFATQVKHVAEATTANRHTKILRIQGLVMKLEDANGKSGQAASDNHSSGVVERDRGSSHPQHPART